MEGILTKAIKRSVFLMKCLGVMCTSLQPNYAQNASLLSSYDFKVK